MPLPTPRLALVLLAAAAVLAVSGASSLGALVALDVVVLAVAVVDWSRGVRASQIELQRAAPEVIVLGGSGTVTWRIVNHATRPATIEVVDDLMPALGADRRRAELVVGAQAAVETDVVCTPRRRGRFEVASVGLRVRSPWGLATSQRTAHVPSVVRVYPAFPSRADAELRVARARITDVGLRSSKGRGTGTEFDQLREYTTDDEFRRVDWAATARLRKPIVRTYRTEQHQTVVCLLDNGRVMAGRVAGVPRVEHAMDAIQCLTTVATRLGDRAGLVTFDRQVRTVVPARTGTAQLGRVNEAMFALEPVLAESDYPGAFATTVARFRRRSLLVVLTDLVDQALADTLVPALPLLSRRHLVVVAAAADPDVVRWADGDPADAREAYLQAAALSALEARARTTARLRGLGAVVVDAPADRLAAALADEYLRAKATGRL